jgi:hypothetical protein
VLQEHLNRNVVLLYLMHALCDLLHHPIYPILNGFELTDLHQLHDLHHDPLHQ